MNKPSKARKKFEKIQAYGFISTTQQGALKAQTIRLLPEGEFPTVSATEATASLYGIARRVLVTVELAEEPALPLPQPCAHERLNEDGICRRCGEDQRRG